MKLAPVPVLCCWKEPLLRTQKRDGVVTHDERGDKANIRPPATLVWGQCCDCCCLVEDLGLLALARSAATVPNGARSCSRRRTYPLPSMGVMEVMWVTSN
jgi:hypothetical protein